MATTNSPKSLGIEEIFRDSPLPVNIIFLEGAAVPVVATVEMWYNGVVQEDVVITTDITDNVLSFELSVLQLRAAAAQRKPYIYLILDGVHAYGNPLKITMNVGVYNPADINITAFDGIGNIRVNVGGDLAEILAQANRIEGYVDEIAGYVDELEALAGGMVAASSGQYLHKYTMAAMRAMTSGEIDAVNAGTYVGVMLHGYYAYGDTPRAITYYKSSTVLADDEGSVIVIGSLKLQHSFTVCDMAYYGLRDATYYDAQNKAGKVATANRNTLMINNAIKIASKVTITTPGIYWCRGNRGGESGSYYRYMSILGQSWNQVGDGNGNPGGINMLSNRTLEMGDGVTLKMRGTFMDAYNFITIWNKENVTIRGGTIIGDFDLDPELNEHIRLDDDGNKLVDGVTCDYTPGGLINCNDGGQWGYGISLQGAQNVLIENLDISKFWADGINITADYINDFAVNTDIVIRNVKSHHNRRQGMSINGGNRLSFYGCTYSYTKGQDPQSGVDLERDTDIESVQLKDVLFFDCNFIGNVIGLVTAQSPEYDIDAKFVNCFFDNNEAEDYNGNTSSKVQFISCRFAYKEGRDRSIRLNGVTNHTFTNCDIGGRVEIAIRDIGTVYKSKDVVFENCKAPDILLPDGKLNFFDLTNSVNIAIKGGSYQCVTLQGDSVLVVADGAENIDLLANTFRELGEVFSIQNVNGFRFNRNSVINTLLSTGRLNANVDRFELCDNTISGNSYHVVSAGKPAFQLLGSGCSRGRISGNTIHSNVIFEAVGALTGTGLGLYREYTNISDNVVILANKTYGYTNPEAFQLNVSSTNQTVTYL